MKMQKRTLGQSGLDVSATGDDLRQISDALDDLEVQGDRYPAALAARAGR